MKTRLIFTLLLLCTLNIFGQWNVLPMVTGHNNFKVSFGSPTDGWMFSIQNLTTNPPTKLFHTTDAGNTWVDQQFELPGNFTPLDLSFVSPSTGFVLYRKSGSTFGLQLVLMRTTDAGISWDNVTPDSTDVGYGNAAVWFSDANHGHFGVGASVYSTSDGGNTWTSIGSTGFMGSASPTCVAGNGTQNVAVGCWDGTFLYSGSVLISNDAGITWDTTEFNTAYSSVVDISYPVVDTVYAIAQLWGTTQIPALFRSFDNGNSWDTLYFQFAADSMTSAMAINFTDGKHGTLALQNGQVMVTQDAGVTWTEEFHAHTLINSMEFNNTDGWIIGEVGYVASNSSGNGIFEPVPRHLKLDLWPNPADHATFMRLPQGWRNAQVSVMDLQGRELIHLYWEIEGNIELNTLPTGMYIIQATNGTETAFARLVKQ